MIITAADIKWVDAPSSLPPGAKITVLEGDPSKAGPYTLRLKAPAGYKIPPHSHPESEHITIISGTAHVGMGEKVDEKSMRALQTGDYAVLPADKPHYAWMKEEAVLQISSMGPYVVVKVAAEDADKPKP